MKFGDPPHYNFSPPHAVVNGVSLITSEPLGLHMTRDYIHIVRQQQVGERGGLSTFLIL